MKTILEFKSWIDGFSESIDDAPTKAQWEKIKGEIANLRVEPIVPQTVPYTPYYPQFERTGPSLPETYPWTPIITCS